MSDKIKIFVVTQKKISNLKLSDIYIPIQVGAAVAPALEYLRDNEGDNISEKNPYYCELTGLYWVWKNIDCEIIGLCHYRRYFVRWYGKIFNIFLNVNSSYYNEKNVLKELSKHDILLHNATYLKQSVEQHYMINHYAQDIKRVRMIIKEMYPSYLGAYDKIMQGHKIHLLNMFIMKKELMDDYCQWLFSILFELENYIDVSKYDDFQKRVFGFIAERLFDIWIYKNKIDFKETFTINTENRNLKFWA